MGKAIWTPPNAEADADRDVFVCLICGTEMREENYERHVAGCAKRHRPEILRYSEQKRPEAIFGEADPEYREWQRKTGKLI